jgi:predicted  nucleic acid-binding Zn-ribbon protein
MAADHKQLQLKTGEAKIVDLRNKLNTCNTNREYQALLEQIAADEMANSVLEDEILEALERIELLQVNIREAEQNVEKARAKLEKVRSEVTDNAARIKGEITRLEAELAEAENNLPSDFRVDYDRMVRGRGEDAMAAVDGDCCGGCYQHLTPNMLNQVHMSQIVACKSCGRLLYLPEDHSIGS